MKFSDIQQGTDYIVTGESTEPLATGDIFSLDFTNDLIIRNRYHIISRSTWPSQIPADLEVREFTDDEYVKMIREKSHVHFTPEEVAKSFRSTALFLARGFRSYQNDQVLLDLQISEWLQDYIELQHTVNDLVNEFGLSTIEDFHSMIYKPKDK